MLINLFVNNLLLQKSVKSVKSVKFDSLLPSRSPFGPTLRLLVLMPAPALDCG